MACSNPSTYSKIISPAKYNALMEQHIYIPQTDAVLCRLISEMAAAYEYVGWTGQLRIVEVGCGPGRLTHKLIERVPSPFSVTALDHDRGFIDYAHAHQVDSPSRALFLEHDVTVGLLGMKGIPVVVSMGFHHHVPRPEGVQAYLTSIRDALAPGGVYFLADEFLAHYATEYERMMRIAVWYGVVIEAACRLGDPSGGELAIEETKTMLDDMGVVKSQELIANALMLATLIGEVALGDSRALVPDRVSNLLRLVEAHKQGPITDTDDPAIALNRGDHKICHAVFQEEVTEAGFKIAGIETVGPQATIGGLTVYALQKA